MERYLRFGRFPLTSDMNSSSDNIGDIIYINAFRNPIIVLNTAEAASQLLDKRSNKYSSRPVRTMASEL
jgi:hypothetical protein